MRWNNGWTMVGGIGFAAGWIMLLFFSGRETELGTQVFNLQQGFISASLILSGLGLMVIGQATEALSELTNVASKSPSPDSSNSKLRMLGDLTNGFSRDTEADLKRNAPVDPELWK